MASGAWQRQGMEPDVLRVLIADIEMTQQRFCVAMEARFEQIAPETLERYFGILSKLVGKLEEREKSLAEVMQEMMADVAQVAMLEMQARVRP